MKAQLEELAQRAWGEPCERVARSLDELARLGPGRTLLALDNAAAASRLLGLLFGPPPEELKPSQAGGPATPNSRPPPPPPPAARASAPAQPATHEQALRTFARLGLAIRARGKLGSPGPALPLPARTEQLLRGLLGALQPASQADVLLYAVEPGAPQAALVPGLLSVRVREGPGLDETLFALACQRYRPLEIVADPEALARLCHLETFTAGETLRGQYLAVLEAGDLVYPQHFADLIAALKLGDAAWGLSRGRERVEKDDGTITSKRDDEAWPYDVASLTRENRARAGGAVFDRLRLGAMDLNNPPATIVDVAALFAPAVVTALPSWERPKRPPPVTAEEDLPVLLSLAELQRAIEQAPAPRWLRYRVADAAFAALHKLGSLARRRP